MKITRFVPTEEELRIEDITLESPNRGMYITC